MGKDNTRTEKLTLVLAMTMQVEIKQLINLVLLWRLQVLDKEEKVYFWQASQIMFSVTVS